LVAAVVAVLSVALAFRVTYVLDTRGYVARYDAASYDAIATSIASGHGWPYKRFGWAYRPPGYPFFLAGIYSVFGVPHGTDRTTARLVQAVFGTVTVALIGVLAWQLWGTAAALVAMGLAAVYLPMVVVGTSLITESLFTLLMLAAVNCAVRARRAVHRYPWVIACGVLCGMLALTRTNGLVVGVALAILIGVRRPSQIWARTPRWRLPQLLAPLLMLLVMVATISPWTIRNANRLHQFVPVSVETGPTLAGTYNDLAKRRDWLWVVGGYHNYDAIIHKPNVNGAVLDRRLIGAVIDYATDHPTVVPQVIFWNTVRLLDLYSRHRSHVTAATDVDSSNGVADAMIYSFWVLGVLALIAIVLGAARGAPKTLWLVPLVLWLSEAIATTGTPRFRAALEPFVVMLAALGLLALARLPRRRAATR
jgi:4-amino-4-deoxy-L-arabinose transferase-like glycosyltransferase